MTVDPNLVSAGLVALVGGGGVWAYLGGKNRNKVDLVTIAQDAAGKVIHSLTEEIYRLQHRADALEAQDERCRTELAELRRRIG
jgi:hypothetical protein